MKLDRIILLGSLAVASLAAPSSFGADAGVDKLLPRGGQRGTEVGVTLSGRHLKDAQEILLYQPGLTVKGLQVVDANNVKVTLAVAPDAALGEHSMRLRTASGLSDLRTFWVGALPMADEKEPNNDFAAPQKIGMNVTVSGVVTSEDVDYYTIEAKKGDRITAEVEGIRLGGAFFDPYVAILDASRFELSANDDTALLMQDPIASCVAPKDGVYVIQVRDSSYGGSGDCAYRMHVGTFPRPRAVFPAGGQVGQDLNVQFLGDVAGTISQSVRLPAEPTTNLKLFAEQNGLSAPSPCHFRVSPFPNVLESEPNNDAKAATAHAADLPAAFNGIIAADKDMDWYRFKAKKGQVLDFNVYGRRVRSPLDPVLVVCNAAGGGLTSNDDSGGPDSYLRFTVPEDGEYTFYVFDQLQRGSPEATYRVEVTPVQPKLTLGIPSVDPNGNGQERHTIVVPRGNRYATLVRATRADFAGEVTIGAENLPAGVTASSENVAANLDVVPVVFEAAADAPIAGKLADLTGKPADGKTPVAGQFVQPIVLVANGNQAAYYKVEKNKVAVAVAEEAQFKLRIEPPKVPLVQSGQMMLKVIAERKPDFKLPIKLQMLFNPPGIGAGQLDIPEGQSEVLIPINASADAAVRKWKICVIGSTEHPDGRQWVSSQLADLEVAPSFVTGKIQLAATEQGKPAPVLCELTQQVKFEGKATLKLVGLPPGATAPDAEITAEDKKVVFNVTTDAKTPAGQHNTLFCQFQIAKNGEPIVQSLAAGGVLRVDAPPPPKPDAPAPPPQPVVAAAPAKPAEKVLTRLEKLRLEQAEKAGAK